MFPGTGTAPGTGRLQSGVGKKRKIEAVPVEELNRRLRKLRKRARKAAGGEGGAKSREALRRWERLEAAGLKPSCCGKEKGTPCRGCPRRDAELVLLPLSRRLDG
jgi:hypothetical protein